MKYNPYKQTKKKTSIIVGIILFFLCLPLIFALGVMCYCNISLEYYPIGGVSMQPLLNPNGIDEDYVYVTSNTNNITYGDVIVYKKSAEISVIKRVIAMGGDNLMIKDTEVSQQGTANNYYAFYIQYKGEGDFVELKEDYIQDKSSYRALYSQFYFEDVSQKDIQQDSQGNLYIHIAEDEIFYAGDNRLNSEDCIDYGPMKKQNLIGEVEYIVYQDSFRVWQVIKQILGIQKWK